jgi:hypothetical protein
VGFRDLYHYQPGGLLSHMVSQTSSPEISVPFSLKSRKKAGHRSPP